MGWQIVLKDRMENFLKNFLVVLATAKNFYVSVKEYINKKALLSLGIANFNC